MKTLKHMKYQRYSNFCFFNLKISDIGSHYEYVWKGKVEKNGQVYYRELPCYCSGCRNGWSFPCINAVEIGEWKKIIQKCTGGRTIKKYVGKKKVANLFQK